MTTLLGLELIAEMWRSWSPSPELVAAEKDVWDKVRIVGTIIASLGVAVIAGLFTRAVGKHQTRVEERLAEERTDRETRAAVQEEQQRERELKVRRVEALQVLFPYLSQTGFNSNTKAALIAIHALGDSEFAADLASLYAGPGGISALSEFSLGRHDPKMAAMANERLTSLVQRLRHSVAVVHDVYGNGIASAFAVTTQHLASAAYVVRDVSSLPLTAELLGNEYPVRIAYKDDSLGVVILEAPDAPLVPMSIAASDSQVNDHIIVVGWDGQRIRWTANPGMVTYISTRNWDSEPLGDLLAGVRRLSSIEVARSAGFAGAPVVNSNLEVIGLHYAADRSGDDSGGGRTLSWMVDANVLRLALDRQGFDEMRSQPTSKSEQVETFKEMTTEAFNEATGFPSPGGASTFALGTPSRFHAAEGPASSKPNSESE